MVDISSDTFGLLTEHLSEVPSRRMRLMRVLDTRQEICALSSAIENYGLSLSLLAFANHNGVLSLASDDIPSSLKGITEEQLTEDTPKILSAIKELELNLIAAEEGFFDRPLVKNTIEHAVKSAVGYLVTSILSIAGVFLYKKYTVWQEDEKNRVATVVPFKVLVGYLKSVTVIQQSLHDLMSVTLPKTADDVLEFQNKIHSITSPLTSVGIHVTGESITVDKFQDPKKDNIENLGYGSSALSQIATLAATAKQSLDQVHSIDFSELDRQFSDDTDHDALSHVKAGYGLIEDIIHTAISRTTKILDLTKRTVSAINKYYTTPQN